MPKIVALKPKIGLPAKLDRLANALADALLDPDVPVAEKIAGLKALSAYRDRRAGEGTVNAFVRYQAAVNERREVAGDGESEDEENEGSPGAA